MDELNSDRIFQMQYVEFLEALARTAEKLSLPALGSVSISMSVICVIKASAKRGSVYFRVYR